MPSGSDWFHFLFINICFIIQIIVITSSITMTNVQDNWTLYRNNPLFLLFSNNPEQEFSYLIQNIQTSYMGYLLEPLNYITSNLGSLGSSLTDGLNDVRVVISNIRTYVTNIIQSIFGVFLNIIIEFQKIIIKIRDLMQKTVAVMSVLLNVVSTSINTMESGWNGPAGEMVRDISNFSCFHPDTFVQLNNGLICQIKEIQPGDILQNNIVVKATMKLVKESHDVFYYFSEGIYGSPIYVTGMHRILYQNQFIYVKDHPEAIKDTSSNSVPVPHVISFITNSHTIPIGSYIFHDWEDDYLL